MYRVFIVNDSAPNRRRLIASTSDPRVVAAAAGYMLADLPKFTAVELRKMISRRRERLLSALEGAAS